MRGRKYIPGNFEVIEVGKFKGVPDVSVETGHESRLNNFYVGGLDWMVQNLGIDGVYFDDTTLDRFAFQRARKIIDRYRPEGRMDLHSFNHFKKSDGLISCLNNYMDLLPYLDFTWIGEGRDYDRMPDYWLIEVSGIPFGLPGQMLWGGGNRWRGMVYGITNRNGWKKPEWKDYAPPTEIWKFWDDHKIADKTMIGYWEKDCPVRCSNSLIKASVFKSADEVIITVANWTDQDKVVSLTINWGKLGMDPGKVEISFPEIKDFQAKQISVSLDKITIPAGKGYVFVMK